VLIDEFLDGVTLAVSQKNIPDIFDSNYQILIIFSVNIPDNLPLNGHSVFTSPSLLLHYLGKENQAKYALKYAKNVKKHPQHY